MRPSQGRCANCCQRSPDAQSAADCCRAYPIHSLSEAVLATCFACLRPCPCPCSCPCPWLCTFLHLLVLTLMCCPLQANISACLWLYTMPPGPPPVEEKPEKEDKSGARPLHTMELRNVTWLLAASATFCGYKLSLHSSMRTLPNIRVHARRHSRDVIPDPPQSQPQPLSLPPCHHLSTPKSLNAHYTRAQDTCQPLDCAHCCLALAFR